MMTRPQVESLPGRIEGGDAWHPAVVPAVLEKAAYRCEVITVGDLDASTVRSMTCLHASMYEATDDARFLADLSEKQEVLLLWHEERLVGFTTMMTYARSWRGQTLRVLYSGDTVVHRAHWGQQALSLAWVRHLGVLKSRHPAERFVWFLLVKGHRTYRYLHVFARRYFPGGDNGCAGLRELADHLARDRFPHDYNPATGLVEFTPSRGHLRPEFARPRADEFGRAGVLEFLRLNPGFEVGHELVCVCEIEDGNMKPLTLRLFRQGARAGAHV